VSSLWFHAGVAAGCLPVSALFGWVALQGFVLGLVGTGASVLGTAGVVRLLATAAENKATPPFGLALITVGFLVKLPIFVGCALVAKGLPGPGPTAFCLGIGLVYCLLIGWAQAKV
jgi:hypothetical protein